MVSRGLEAISLTLIKKLDTNFEFSGFSDQVSQSGTFSVSDDFGKKLCLQILHFNKSISFVTSDILVAKDKSVKNPSKSPSCQGSNLRNNFKLYSKDVQTTSSPSH